MSSDAKAAHARAAGADIVINYRSEDVVERIRATVGGVDRVVDVDFGRNLPVTSKVLRPDAVIASYASMGDLEPKFPYRDLFQLNPTIRPVFVYTMPDAAKAQAHADIARWLAQATSDIRDCRALSAGRSGGGSSRRRARRENRARDPRHRLMAEAQIYCAKNSFTL